MPLVKVRNNTSTIIFVDSMNLTIRPHKTPADFILIDEAKVDGDAQLAKCVMTGMLSKCKMDEEFVDKKAAEKKKEPPQEIEGRIKNLTKKSDKKEVKSEPQEEGVVEPKNTKSVVFAGKDDDGKIKVANALTINRSESPLPGFIDKKDIVDLNMDDIEKEDQGEKDIIYADMN